MSAVTREDREAAVRMMLGESLVTSSDFAVWLATGDVVDTIFASTQADLNAYAEAFAAHRVRSTQALREAAGRLAIEAEACVMGHCTRDDMMPAIAALRALLDGKDKP